MPLCLQQNLDGTLSAVSPQPVEPSGCSLVVLSGPEFVSVQANPWNLTPEQALQIGGAILTVWACAWTWRLVAMPVRSSFKSETEEL